MALYKILYVLSQFLLIFETFNLFPKAITTFSSILEPFTFMFVIYPHLNTTNRLYLFHT